MSIDQEWEAQTAVEDWAEDEDTEVSLPRKPLEETEMDITPMIDITFLLLIFFLVASKMDPDAQLVLPKARNGTAVPEASSIIITMTAGDGDEAVVYKGNGNDPSMLVSAADPAEQEAELVEYIEAGFDQGMEQVVIKAEKDVKHREVARVARAVGLVPDAMLYVAVLETH